MNLVLFIFCLKNDKNIDELTWQLDKIQHNISI